MHPYSLLVALGIFASGTLLAYFSLDPSPSSETRQLQDLGRSFRILESTPPVTPQRNFVDASLDGRHREISSPDAAFAPFSGPSLRATFTYKSEDGAQDSQRFVQRGQNFIQLGNPDAAEFIWLQRNPVAPNRSTGFHVRHDFQHILEYSDSDLEQEGVAESWSTMASFGVRPEEFQDLEETGEVEMGFGLEFVCFVPAQALDKEGALIELWWNEELHLPLRWTRHSSASNFSQELIELNLDIDQDAAIHPHQRWAEYELLDLVDYREELEFEEGHKH